MTVRPLSGYDYRWVLDDPEALGVPSLDGAPLPALMEPPDQPPVVAASAEPLVEVAHRRVRTVAVYWHAGWPAAQAATLLRVGAAGRLYRAAESLPDRFGLAVLDGWRPLGLQSDIFDAAYADPALPAGFVSVPSADPATPPPHATGGTVDVTLTFDGRPLALGSGFDDFTDAARTASFEDCPGVVRDPRRLLYHSMRAAGFVVIDCEWWHFEFGTRRWAALVGREPIYGAARPALRSAS